MYEKVADIPNAVVVDTTSKSGQWKDLSPFFLGPYIMPNGQVSQNFENLWQYAKVYKKFTDEKGNPTPEYFTWAKSGWDNPRAVRYPMGRGAIPEYSLWKEQHLGYIEARKAIYGPIYAELVQRTDAYKDLKKIYEESELVILRDYDGYNHDKLNMSLTEVVNNPKKKMGHAFVIKMLLTEDIAIQEFDVLSLSSALDVFRSYGFNY